jgi:hypothetical protein
MALVTEGARSSLPGYKHYLRHFWLFTETCYFPPVSSTTTEAIGSGAFAGI